MSDKYAQAIDIIMEKLGYYYGRNDNGGWEWLKKDNN